MLHYVILYCIGSGRVGSGGVACRGRCLGRGVGQGTRPAPGGPAALREGRWAGATAEENDPSVTLPRRY